MRMIKPKYEIWEQPSGLEGIYEQIERAGRICYKSSPKYRWFSKDKKRWINEDSEDWKAFENPKKVYPIREKNISAKPFVDRMIASGHGAMLEHGTVYLKVPNVGLLRNFIDNTPSHFDYGWCRTNPVMDEDNNVYITTNYRHIIEYNLEDYLKYLCEPTEYHAKRITVHFVCDRGVSHEFVRHRVFSFAQESTRYCNYSKDKFGNEITFIEPCWLNIPEGKYTNIAKQSSEDGEYKQIMLHENNINAYPLTTTPEGRFLWDCLWSEHDYFDLISQGWKPQQARAVLPNALKTELVMTGFVDDWKHFFFLRCPVNAHPQARELAIPLSDEFVKRDYFNKKDKEKK